jgi:hypothetical protein
MSKFCPHCGNPLKEGYKYCEHCGSPISEGFPLKTNFHHESQPVIKKGSKYLLNSSQRNIFLQKILPLLIVGSIIWLFSEIIFSMIFIDIKFTHIFLVFYVFMIIIEGILFLLFYFSSKANRIQLGVLIFFLFCFIAGILSLPIIIITEFLPQVHMFVTLSLGATLIVGFIGIILRENYFSKGYIWAHIILFLIGMSILEIIFIFIFKIQNFLLTIPVSLAYILVVALTTMFYGAKAVQKNEKDPWIYIFFKIEGLLLLALIIAAIIVVVVLIIVAIGIACGGGNFDFSGLSSGSRSKEKRKKM